MICSFFGHRDPTASIYPQLIKCIETLIKERNISYFIVGNNGQFDDMVLTSLQELKQKYSHIRYNIVPAYVPSEQIKYESYISEETFLPVGIESVPKRFAIPWRNKKRPMAFKPQGVFPKRLFVNFPYPSEELFS